MTLRDWLLLMALLGFTLAGSAGVAPSVRDGREGIVTHMGPGYPAHYLAIPLGPGVRVSICGPARCLTLTSTDAGPNRAMLQAGRIADVSVPLFRSLCGCSESRGAFTGSWRLAGIGPRMTLPPTDTLPVAP
jgi:hypothetical protein